MKYFEPINKNLLDEVYSNATDTVGAIAEGVGALANLGKAGVQNKGKKLDILSDTGCVKPRGIGKKRKRAEKEYEKCLQNNKQRILDDKKQDREAAKKIVSDSYKSKEEQKKIDLESKKIDNEHKTNRVKYIIGGLILVSAIAAFIAYKKIKK